MYCCLPKTLVGPIKILRLAGSVGAAREVFSLIIINADDTKAKININCAIFFSNISHLML